MSSVYLSCDKMTSELCHTKQYLRKAGAAEALIGMNESITYLTLSMLGKITADDILK